MLPPGSTLLLSSAFIGIFALLVGCESTPLYLAGEPPQDAALRMEVGDRDSIGDSSGVRQRWRSIHVDWQIPEADFPRFQYTLIHGPEIVRIDTIAAPVGQVDFLWKCPQDRYADTARCEPVKSLHATLYVSLPEGYLLRVARAWEGR